MNILLENMSEKDSSLGDKDTHRQHKRTGDCSEETIGREFRPALVPLYDLRLLDDGETWESTGIDPQSNVAGPWPKGRRKVPLKIETEQEGTGTPILSIDRGRGDSEYDTSR